MEIQTNFGSSPDFYICFQSTQRSLNLSYKIRKTKYAMFVKYISLKGIGLLNENLIFVSFQNHTIQPQTYFLNGQVINAFQIMSMSKNAEEVRLVNSINSSEKFCVDFSQCREIVIKVHNALGEYIPNVSICVVMGFTEIK